MACAVATWIQDGLAWMFAVLVGEPMDEILQRFLAAARSSARPAHRATYEDLVFTLDAFLLMRRRDTRRMTAKDLRLFLGSWYLRQCRPLTPGRIRRFCAAARVFVRWLTLESTPRRRRDLQRESKTIARAVLRAGRASEKLELLDQLQLEPRRQGSAHVDDYCENVVRGERHLVLRPLSSGTLVGPVEVPDDLAAALDPGALVNLRLTQDAGRWRIQEYGYCYPASARAALDDINGSFTWTRMEGQ